MKMFASSLIAFRQAAPEEADALSQLALRSKGYWGYSEEFLRACQAELTYSAARIQAASAFVVAEFEGATAGFYALAPSERGELELEALFVDPAYVGQGIGRALLTHAKATARTKGATVLTIQADPHAERFYEMAGGEQVGARESCSIPGRMLPVFEVRLEAPDDA